MAQAQHAMPFPTAGMRVTVSAELPLDAHVYLLERDGAAFRSFMCEEVRPTTSGDIFLLIAACVAARAQRPCSNVQSGPDPLVRAVMTPMPLQMSLLEYEITKCWREGPATMIRLNSKPDVGAWIPGALAQKVCARHRPAPCHVQHRLVDMAAPLLAECTREALCPALLARPSFNHGRHGFHAKFTLPLAGCRCLTSWSISTRCGWRPVVRHPCRWDRGGPRLPLGGPQPALSLPFPAHPDHLPARAAACCRAL